MSYLFSARCDTLIEGKTYQQLLIFSYRNDFDPEVVVAKIDSQLSGSSFPDEIVIAVPLVMVNQIESLWRKDTILKTYTERFSKRSAISLVGFCRFGHEQKKVHLAGTEPSTSIKIQLLSRQIITKLFLRHGGFVESTGSYHFENPSGRHSIKFIRLANILIESEEIGFMAFACLPFIKENAHHLYIDTPALHSVASSINEIRSAFDLPLLNVRNFHSYKGLEKLQLEFGDDLIFLISASSSGGLSRLLVEKFRVADDNIVHFLYLGKSTKVKNIICDLGKDRSLNPDGYQDIPEVFPKSNCDYCTQGSVAIPLYGEQFDVINSQPEPILIRNCCEIRPS